MSDDRLRGDVLEALCERNGFVARSVDPGTSTVPGDLDVLVVDVDASMPPRLLTTDPSVRVLVLRGRVDALDHHEIALEHLDPQASVADAVRAIASGTGAGVLAGTPLAERSSPRLTGALTDREREVLEQLLTGDDTVTIGERLGISEHTVRTHVQNLLPKLGVNSRADAAIVALEEGLRPPTVAVG